MWFRVKLEIETVLLKSSTLMILVFGASPTSSNDGCHHLNDKGRSPSDASQVILVRLSTVKSSLNWNGTILGGVVGLLWCLCFVWDVVVNSKMANMKQPIVLWRLNILMTVIAEKIWNENKYLRLSLQGRCSLNRKYEISCPNNWTILGQLMAWRKEISATNCWKMGIMQLYTVTWNKMVPILLSSN